MMRYSVLSFAKLLVALPLLLVGCGAEETGDHAQCSNDTVREIPCGAGGVQQAQRCVNFRWEDVGFCVDPNACEAGDKNLESCGILNAGSQSLHCENGKWSKQGVCEEVYECSDGQLSGVACGKNNRGTGVRRCVDNYWGASVGACDDTDQCKDHDVDEVACSTPGFNDTIMKERTCVVGKWSDYTSCDDPDVCTNGTSEAVVCGADGSGSQERSCANGQWDYDEACYQRASRLFAGVNALFALPYPHDTEASVDLLALGSNENQFLQIGKPRSGWVAYPSKSHAPPPKKALGGNHVSASSTHQCVIKGADQQLYCWGDNEHGQLGLDPRESPALMEPPARPVDGFSDPVTSVSVGEGFTCALSGAEVYCWGRNDESQLGVEQRGSLKRHTPVRVNVGLGGGPFGLTPSVIALAAGEAHVCVATEDSEIYCWGRNASHQAAEAQVDVVDEPTLHLSLSRKKGAVPTGFKFDSLAAGSNHTLAVWRPEAPSSNLHHFILGVGDNEQGQLGVPNSKQPFVKEAARVHERSGGEFGGDVYRALAAGNTTCVYSYATSDSKRFASQELKCTGANPHGALGTSRALEFFEFQSVIEGESLFPRGYALEEVVLMNTSLCARLWNTKEGLTNRVTCRGDNAEGQLGDGTLTSRARSAFMQHRVMAD